jgi:hypothetical protein
MPNRIWRTVLLYALRVKRAACISCRCSIDWQRDHFETMVAAVRDGGDVPAAMREFLPSETLAFLMELSVEPLR